MPDKSWKATERAHAEILGGERTGPQGKGGRDITSKYPLCVESKRRKRIPMWIWDALIQATLDAREGEIPVGIWHEHGAHHLNDLVTMRLKHLKQIMEERHGMLQVLRAVDAWLLGPTGSCDGELEDIRDQVGELARIEK